MQTKPICLTILLSFLLMPARSTAQDDWARWRGPTGNGIAAAGQTPPIEWDSETNVVWKVKVPGRGHASPIVVGDKLVLATANKEKQTQSVLCFDRKAGTMLWNQEVNQGGFSSRIHLKNTHASPTIATDGESVFAVFSHHGGVEVTALDFEGKQVWNKRVGVYRPKYPFG